MDYKQEWVETYLNSEKVTTSSTQTVRGVCKRAFGGRFLFAVVKLTIKPSNELKFTSLLPDIQNKRFKDEEWFLYTTLGVLDSMLTRPPTPITNFECIIEAIEFHEIDSSKMAFRLAARNAAEEFLKKEKFNGI